MKKLFAIACSVLFNLSVVGAGPKDIINAYNELLNGVTELPPRAGAVLGSYVVEGGNSFPIALCRSADGSDGVVAAGAFYGAGRAIYIAHPGYLIGEQHPQTSRFMKNAVAWTVKGKNEPRIAVLRNRQVFDSLKKIGYASVKLVSSVDEVFDIDLLVAFGMPKSEAPKILQLVKNGVGLVNANLGWVHSQQISHESFADTFPDNFVGAEMGVMMCAGYVSAINGTYPVVRSPKLGLTVNDAIPHMRDYVKMAKETRVQAMGTLSNLIESLPSSMRPDLHDKIKELTNHPDADKVPTHTKPLGENESLARFAILVRKNAWLADPEKPVRAEKSASTYPGAVKEGTPRIEKTVDINLSVPRWHSTGVYAVAGEGVTVELPKEVLDKGLRVRIGTTVGNLCNKPAWHRAPYVTCEVPLVKEKTIVYNPFGGLVYIVVPEGKKDLAGVVSVKLSGGVMAPWFRLGRDTKESFERECRQTGAPYGEIQAKDIIITAETVSLKKVDDPVWMAEHWDKILASSQELAQWKERKSPERICSDVQLMAGFMHAGYPIMTHIEFSNRIDWALDRARLEAGGAWGCYHEVGHNHQNYDWTPDGMVEVTVNLFTLHTIETVVGKNIRDDVFHSGTTHAKRYVDVWVSRGKPFSEMKTNPFLALEMFVRIKEAYGWDLYKKVFSRYLRKDFNRPRNDSEKWQILAKELSAAAGADIGAVFADWSVPLTEETRKACAVYPPATVVGLPTK